MAAGFRILRNNNSYCACPNLSSKAANASAAGYFDTLEKKLSRKSSTENSLTLCLSAPFLLPAALSAVYIPINVAGPGFKVLVSMTQEEDVSVWALRECGRSKRRDTWLCVSVPRPV